MLSKKRMAELEHSRRRLSEVIMTPHVIKTPSGHYTSWHITRKPVMDRYEQNLLMYFETCCVDGSGRCDRRHMNDEEIELAEDWDKTGYVTFGRLKLAHITTGSTKTYAVRLSEQAWNDVSKYRKERADRCCLTLERDMLCGN